MAVTASAPPAPRSCKAILDSIAALKLAADSQVEDDGTSCTATDLTAFGGPAQGWHVDRLTIASADLRQAARSRGIPRDLSLDASGISYTPDLANSHTRYLIQVREHSFDLHLHYNWDVASRELRLKDASLDDKRMGHVGLAMDAIVPNIDALAAPPHMDGVAVRRVDLVLDNHGVMEAMLLAMVVDMLPADVDPAVQIPKELVHQENMLRALPASVVDAASKDAMIRFTRDFPHPSGHFAMSLIFDAPMTLDDLTKLASAKNPGAWAHLRIEASYVGATVPAQAPPVQVPRSVPVSSPPAASQR